MRPVRLCFLAAAAAVVLARADLSASGGPSFEANIGQLDARAAFVARSRGGTLFLTADGAVLARPGAEPLVVRPAAAAPLTWTGREPLPERVHYRIGSQPSRWRTDVPTYASVESSEVWPGIRLVFRSAAEGLEYDLVVSPGADPHLIALEFGEARSIRLGRGGDLVVELRGGEAVQRRPSVYQEAAGARRPVPGRWVLRGRRAGFEVGPYDPRLPLVIDPALAYSTFLGGDGFDAANALFVDGSGNAYVAGTSTSLNFPTSLGAVQQGTAGSSDAFVAKFSPSGARIWATYLGGSDIDIGNAVAADPAGNVYVGGETDSSDFPHPGGVQTGNGGGRDGFVARLNSSGTTLDWATYVGGSGEDRVSALASDASGVYLAGRTGSNNLKTTPGCFQPGYRGGDFDAWAAKLSSSGVLVYLTYVGGNDNDAAFGIAVDDAGNAHLTGGTKSADFPTTMTAYRSTPLATDAWMAKLNASGSGLLYSTVLGGSGTDRGNAIAIGPGGTVYLAGQATSTDFPVTPNAAQVAYGGGQNDAFVAKLDPSASGAASLVWATYLGGNGDDRANAIAVNATGVATVAGQTTGGIPALNAFQPGYAGGANDAFLAQFPVSGKPRVFATNLGDGGDDRALGVGIDAQGLVYVAGRTDSARFPTANPFQGRSGGGTDAFLAKLDQSATAPAGAAGVPALQPAGLIVLAALLAAAGTLAARTR